MKRKLSGILCLCLLAGVCGCSPAEKSTALPTTGSSGTAENGDAGQEDSLYILSGETERGLYHTGEYKGKVRICFVDYETCKDTVLCSKPGCTHDTETCMASPSEGKNIYFVYALRDGGIAYVESNDQNDEGPERICLADADGSNRRVLATAQNEQAYLNLLCADQDNLYFLQSDYEGHKQLFRVSLEDGTMEALWEVPNSTSDLQGVDGRNLIWYSFSNNQEEIAPLTLTEDMTEEEIQQEEERYQASLDTLVARYRVYRFSIDTGEEQDLLTWTSSYGSQARSVLWDDSRLYWVESDRPGDLHWTSRDGSSGEAAIQWPEEIISAQDADDMAIYMEQMLEGKILLTVFGPWGMNQVKRYALEPDRGTLQEIPLQYISNAAEKPVRILGKTENELLVEFEERANNTEYIDADGLPAKTLTFSYRRGLLSGEDFFAGRPNYREVRPLES